MVLIWVSLVIGALIICLLYKWATGPSLPRGPRGLPFVGNMFQIDPTGLHKTLSKWGETYGGVFTISVLGQDIVVLRSFEALYEGLVLKENDLSGRPPCYRARQVAYKEGSSLGFIDCGFFWKNLRSSFHSGVKMYGTGFHHLEVMLADILEELVESIEKKANQAFVIEDDIYKAISASMWVMALGERLALDDPRLGQFREWTRMFTESMDMGGDLDAFPALRYLGHKQYKQLCEVKRLREEQLCPYLEKAKLNLDTENTKLFLENVLAFHSRYTEEHGTEPFTEANAFHTVAEFMLAGLDTSGASLTGLFLILINFPDVQHKIQQEIDKVVGTGRQPQLADRPDMPYTEATLLEHMRLHSTLPLGLIRRTTRDTVIQGHHIPEDTAVITDFYGLHHDKDQFPDPFVIKPERFLDDNGQLLQLDHPRRKRWMPFSVGRRNCPGEQIARHRMFLLVTYLLQKFTFSAPDGEKPAHPDPRNYMNGVVIKPKTFKVKATLRK